MCLCQKPGSQATARGSRLKNFRETSDDNATTDDGDGTGSDDGGGVWAGGG